MKVLEDGCVKANEKANATLKRAKDAMKINYFDDKDNITEYFNISRIGFLFEVCLVKYWKNMEIEVR